MLFSGKEVFGTEGDLDPLKLPHLYRGIYM